MRNTLFFIAAIAFSFSTIAQFRNRPPEWTTKWITYSEVEPNAETLLLFRKSFNLEEVPDSFKVKITADNRFKLYVNGEFAGIGPSIGDLQHWNYENYKKMNLPNTLALETSWNFS